MFYLVTEFESRIEGHVISFGSTPATISIKELPASGSISSVRLDKVKTFFNSNTHNIISPKIIVFLNGKLTNIRLGSRHLLKDYVRLIFEFDNTVEGKTWLVLKGLVEQHGDFLPRLRCNSRKRFKMYSEREATLGLVEIDRAIVLEDKNQAVKESITKQENTPDVGIADDSIEHQILGLTSSGNRSLTYHEPSIINGTMVGEISDDDLDEDQVRNSKGSLIAYVGIQISKEEVEEALQGFELLQIKDVADGFIAIHFANENVSFEVLDKGQWFINEKPLILKTWSADIVYNPRDFLVKLPLWIKLHGLDSACWTMKFFSKVCRTIGVPLRMDDCTARKARSDFARVCIQVDTREELKDETHFRYKGNMTRLFVEYEWKFAGWEMFNLITVISPPELMLQQNIDMMSQNIARQVNYRAPASAGGVRKYLLFVIMGIIALLGEVTFGHSLDWRC